MEDLPAGSLLECVGDINTWREEGRDAERIGQREGLSCNAVAAWSLAHLGGAVPLGRPFRVPLNEGRNRKFEVLHQLVIVFGMPPK